MSVLKFLKVHMYLASTIIFLNLVLPEGGANDRAFSGEKPAITKDVFSSIENLCDSGAVDCKVSDELKPELTAALSIAAGRAMVIE